MFRRIPFHPLLFTIYPILALLGYNIHEVDERVALRPLLVSLAGATLLFALGLVISRQARKAGLITTLVAVLFFTYGHLYTFLETHPLLGFHLGRHRYLAVLYLALLILGIFWILRKTKDTAQITLVLNLVGIVLLIYPIFQIANNAIQATISRQRLAASESSELAPRDPAHLPDVYFFLLDMYTRGDALQQDFGYDNTPFLDGLRQMGFYVADCSRSNYDFTHASLTATLNLSYLPPLRQKIAEKGLPEDQVWTYIRLNLVRQQLEALGYSTVAFDSGFEWGRLEDADVYLQYQPRPSEMQILLPFEDMLMRTTALLIWVDSTYERFATSGDSVSQASAAPAGFPHMDHVNRQLFILNELPKIPLRPGPKFVFTHIIIPHFPFVFDPQGNLTTDPRFFSGPSMSPTDEEHVQTGYVNQVQYINNRMLPILQAIISQSKNPPIIVLMGDHGLREDNRLKILNAYYLPDGDYSTFYQTITPVNSFRLIFNAYFGGHYPLLPDESYKAEKELVAEDSPACRGK